MHPVLDNQDPVKMVEIQAQFINLAKKIKFNDTFLKEYNLDGFLTVPVIKEGLEIPDYLQEAIKEVLEVSADRQDIEEAARSLIQNLKPNYEMLNWHYPKEFIAEHAFEQLRNIVQNS